MAQNVTVAGASYSDVPSVELPKTGGGTALFADPSITTAVASDVASGKQFLLADGSIGTGTASGGGGGASNIVTGTFKGTTTGAAMDVTLNYSGSGRPVAVLIFPSEGAYNSSGTFYNTLQRYAACTYVGVCYSTSASPSYTTVNDAYITVLYKSSASTARTLSYTNFSANDLLSNTSATGASAPGIVKITSATNMSVYIASSSYGFMANIPYTYQVIYSS